MDNTEDYSFILKVDDKDFGKNNYRITSVDMDKAGGNIEPGEDINLAVGSKG